MSVRVYLDHAATTPLRPVARAAMLAAADDWANPSSPHAEGRAARAALETARGRIAAALDWPHAVLFTSGATEAIGTAMARADAGPRLIGATEHDAVRRVAHDMVLPVDSDGIVDVRGIAGRRPLVAVQLVNSETGVVQPAGAVAAAVARAGALWLCDATQAAGKIPLPPADFIAISAHKFGGPPGIGALLVRDLETLAATGGQEGGYRGGTENLPAVAGMAAAIEEGAGWLARAAELRTQCDAAIEAAGGEIVARDAPRLPTIAGYRMPGTSARAQLIRFDLAGFAVSAGSACASGTMRRGHVHEAMGIGETASAETIRVSFGRTTRREEVWRFCDAWGALAREAAARAA